MNSLVRRRTVAGALTAAGALVVGLVVAPSVLAAPNALSISPGLAFNTETAKTLAFTGRDATFQYGATAVFTGGTIPASFSVTTAADQAVTARRTSGTATVNFTDLSSANNDTDSGVGRDGPVDAGTYGVSVTGKSGNPVQEQAFPGGGNDTCQSCFLVNSAGPVAVSSLTPTSLRPNTTANVTVTGNNFERGSIIELLLPGTTTVDTTITTNLPPVNADATTQFQGITTRTTLQRQFKIAGAATGPRDVRVRNLDGNAATCAGCFNIAGPTLTSISKPGGTNEPGQALTTITFNGSAVVNGTPALEFIAAPGGASRSSLTITGTTPRDYTGTSITADFDLTNAAPGDNAYQPVVRGNDGFNACDVCRFTVTQAASRVPTIASMDSDTATAGIQKDIKQGETKDFFVTGTNFSKGAALSFTPAGLTVTSVDFVSPETLRTTITAANPTPTGGRDAVVTLTDTKKSNTCTGCVNVAASASPSASASASATRSATPTASMTASPTCPVNGLTVRVNTQTVNATGLASVTVSGASASATVELQGYSQNHQGTVTFESDPTKVDRSGRADNNGSITFNDLRPASNTRLRARQVGCTYNGNTDVINVRAQETLEVKRVSSLKYTFSGKSIPAREGGLIVSLYRITGQACAAGVEPKSCPGETFLSQARARADNGQFSITVTFAAKDRNTRDEFVVKTGKDAQNAPGRSNARSLSIF